MRYLSPFSLQHCIGKTPSHIAHMLIKALDGSLTTTVGLKTPVPFDVRITLPGTYPTTTLVQCTGVYAGLTPVG